MIDVKKLERVLERVIETNWRKEEILGAIKVNHSELPDTRIFKRQMFLGNGHHSEEQCFLLHKRLELAISWLSGLQQGGADHGTPLYAEAIEAINGVVLDVATALGVRVEIKGELPYDEVQ